MKKIVLAIAILSFSVIDVQAQMSQGDFTFGAGIHLGLPVGDFHQTHTFGVGVQAQGEYAFAQQVTGVATTGYTNFFGKSVSGFKYDHVGLIPILVGARFYPSEAFFVGAQIGLGILTGDGSSSAFDYYPQVGYNADNYQLILGYNGLTKNGATLGHIGLTGIFKFGGK